MGIPPIEYQYQLRVTRARELLVTTDMSIQEIALAVGFHNAPDIHQLCQIFLHLFVAAAFRLVEALACLLLAEIGVACAGHVLHGENRRLFVISPGQQAVVQSGGNLDLYFVFPLLHASGPTAGISFHGISSTVPASMGVFFVS